MKASQSVLAALLFAAHSSSVIAAPDIFTSRDAFSLVSGPVTFVDFDALPVGNLNPPKHLFDPCIFVTPSVTFTATLGIPGYNQPPLLYITEIGLAGSGKKILGTAGGADAPDQFFFEFTGRAFGLEISDLGVNTSVNLRVASASLESYDLAINPTTGDDFIGMAGLADGNWRVSLYYGPHAESNFFIRNVAVAPEPQSILFVAIGALGVSATRRRAARVR